MTIMYERKYNRKTKTHDIIDANGETFEEYADKHSAFKRLIQLFDRTVYALADDFAQSPYLASRAWKGAALVRDGAVDIVNDITALVTGSSEFGAYLLQFNDGLWECECSDYESGQAPICTDFQTRCKHICAVEFELARRESMQSESELYGVAVA